MFQVLAPLLYVVTLPQVDRPVPSELTRCAEFLAQDLIDREGVSALSVCIRVDAAPAVVIARGWLDANRGQRITTDTRFPVGSLSRVFNAAAVLQQVEHGALALDDDIAKRLPGGLALTRAVRVREVLEGTSGIAPWVRVFAQTGKTPDVALTKETLFALFGTAPFDFAPGTDYASNSAAWALIPFVLERAWDQPYAAGLRENVLSAAGLTSTQVCAPSGATFGVIQDSESAAESHDLELALARSSPAALPTLCCTAADLAAWMEALGSGRVVGAEQLATMTTAAESKGGASTGHGYALDLDELAQHPRWWHSGGIGNFRARMSWYPGDRLAVAVLANCASADVDALETELARFVLGLPATRRLDLPLTPQESARFTGGYQIATTRVRISTRAGHLLWQDAQSERNCAWQGRTEFVDIADPQFVLRFEREGERATKFELQRGSSTVSGLRVD